MIVDELVKVVKVLTGSLDCQAKQLSVAREALHKYGRHHDNCESLRHRRLTRHHRRCTCGYIAARHRADPKWLSDCKQCSREEAAG